MEERRCHAMAQLADHDKSYIASEFLPHAVFPDFDSHVSFCVA